MTIEGLEPAPEAQAAEVPPPSEQENLRALVRTLADQAKAADQRSAAADRRTAELAERVALLEGSRRGVGGTTTTTTETSDCDDDEKRLSPGEKGRLGSVGISFAWRREDQRLTKDAVDRRSDIVQNEAANDYLHAKITSPRAEAKANANDPVNTSSLKSVVGIPEDNVEEALADRLTFIERRLETYEEEKAAFIGDERKYALPESTFTFLVTHDPLSVPFAFAVFSVALSITCLALTLASSAQQGSKGNRLGIPAGVDPEVRAAQFLGAIVGVLMEDEIPQGLQLIANGAGHTLLLNGNKAVHKRVVVSSIFRLVVGYLFLSSLFINISQNSDVISIFYDVLALEFVENIDDTTYALAKRGFFGRDMLVAANQSYNLEIAGARGLAPPASGLGESTSTLLERRLSISGMIASNNRVNSLVRLVYFLNAAIILAGLGYVTLTQERGLYRCNSISVLFDEEVWERAEVTFPNGRHEERLLIYSTFNGVYKVTGILDGYPRYVEQNKYDGSAFGPSVKGAEIVYCNEIDSWVFKHPYISTGNECDWLWRSPETEDYDIISASFGLWKAWTGEVMPLVGVSITCNECSENRDCNYHGMCENQVCICDDNHFGEFCEFGTPCESLASEKAQTNDPINGVKWEQDNPIKLWGSNPDIWHRVYDRPVYIQQGLSGEPYDMRLYKLREKEVSPSPSTQPSAFPSLSEGPTVIPSSLPTYKPTSLPPTVAPSLSLVEKGSEPTSSPTILAPFEVGMGQAPPEQESSGLFPTSQPLSEPLTKPLHKQKEYDTAPDFADWDDFFESPSLHDLEDILEDFSVVISYSGSRFYGTIIEPNKTLADLFPTDYHAFWHQSFDVNRTFIISDTTSNGSPVGIDFFEMRRRVDSIRNPNVHFSYGPFGALIPLMDYQNTGFFHCLDEMSQPSTSPSKY